MPDDLLLVVLCELGERMLAMREVLAEPSVAAKPHARAVAALLTHGLDALEARLRRDVLARLAQQGDGAEQTPAFLDTLYQCGQALRALHSRLGLLDMRWSAAPVDIFLRKLRDDVGADLPHPAVVLSDDYAALDDDVAESLYAELKRAGVEADGDAGMEPTVALPRIETADPLTWPLLLPALARIYLSRQGGPHARDGIHRHPAVDALVAARLVGPAVFAARAAQALLFTPVDASAWAPSVLALQRAAAAYAGGLETGDQDTGAFGDSGAIAVFGRLLRARDRVLDRGWSSGQMVNLGDEGWSYLGLSAPDAPTATETQALLAKLVAGTPINAIDPPVPDDFLACLERVDTPDAFYALIGPLGERPAALAAILGVGWLYKVRYSYPLFGQVLREQGGAGDIGRVLAAYRPHMLERNSLLAQSIEAAHVQGIFARGKLEEG